MPLIRRRVTRTTQPMTPARLVAPLRPWELYTCANPALLTAWAAGNVDTTYGAAPTTTVDRAGLRCFGPGQGRYLLGTAPSFPWSPAEGATVYWKAVAIGSGNGSASHYPAAWARGDANNVNIGVRYSSFGGNAGFGASFQTDAGGGGTDGIATFPVGTIVNAVATWRRNQAAGFRVFMNGRLVYSTATPDAGLGTVNPVAPFALNMADSGTAPTDVSTAIGGFLSRAMTDDEAIYYSADAARVFEGASREFFTITPLASFVPTSDIAAPGWTASPAGSLFGAIDEAGGDDADFIITDLLSPTSATFGIGPLPPGSYMVNVRTGSASGKASMTVKLQDSGGATLATSAPQTIGAVLAPYAFPLTIATGTATRIRIEITP